MDSSQYVAPPGVNPGSNCLTCPCITSNGTVSPTPAPSMQIIDLNSNFGEAWGAVIIAISSLGILISFVLIVILLFIYPVKGGTSILGYMLLFGVMTMYLLNFAFVRMPDEHICGIRRFCLGFVHAWCFACLLIKTLFIMHVKSDSSLDIEPEETLSVFGQRKGAHPFIVFLATALLILFQVQCFVYFIAILSNCF